MSDVNKIYKQILDEIFDTFKQLIRTNSKLYNRLSDDYKAGIMFYMKMIPTEYSDYIVKAYAIAKEYLTCIDIHKFLEITAKWNMVSLKIDSQQLLGTFIIESFNDMVVRRFVSEIVNRLDRVFDCIDFMFANPKIILKNANIFDKVEDVFA